MQILESYDDPKLLRNKEYERLKIIELLSKDIGSSNPAIVV